MPLLAGSDVAPSQLDRIGIFLLFDAKSRQYMVECDRTEGDTIRVASKRSIMDLYRP